MSPFQIQCIVADYYGLEREALIRKRRMQKTSLARHVAMYLCRVCFDLSYPAIGTAFGGRDHTTVIQAVRKITKLLRTDATVSADVTELRKRINAPKAAIEQDGYQLSEIDRALIVREVLLEIGRRFKMEAA